MKKWTSKTNKNSPFEIDNITGGGYICFDCKNNNSFDGEFNIYRYYYKDDGEWDFDFEILVPMAIQCAECGSDDIVVEYNPGWYFSALKEGDECYNLTLISDNKLINFEDSEGYFKLFDQLGCIEDMCNNSSTIIDEMAEWEFNDPPFIDIKSDINCVVARIIVKNGMEQDTDSIFDAGGTYKEFSVSVGGSYKLSDNNITIDNEIKSPNNLNPKEQINLFKKQESQAKDTQDYIILAESISKTLGDNDWAKKLLEEAEKLIKEDVLPDRYIDIAESAADDDFLGNKVYAKEIYQRIEKYSEKVRFLKKINISKSCWLQYLGDSIAKDNSLGDKVWAKELYQKAVELLTGAEYQDHIDWFLLADSIYKSLGDNDWAKELFQKAIDFAENTYDYCSIAESIMNSIGDIDYTKIILQIAEQKSKEGYDFVYLANYTAKILKDYKLSINYYKKAESTADATFKNGIDYRDEEYGPIEYSRELCNIADDIKVYLYNEGVIDKSIVKGDDPSIIKNYMLSLIEKIEAFSEKNIKSLECDTFIQIAEIVKDGDYFNKKLFIKAVKNATTLDVVGSWHSESGERHGQIIYTIESSLLNTKDKNKLKRDIKNLKKTILEQQKQAEKEKAAEEERKKKAKVKKSPIDKLSDMNF